MKHRAIVDRMTLEEKIALCSGADFFATRAYPHLGIPSIAMADGPHGIRRQLSSADHLGIDESLPATCFPTAALTACSWDRELHRVLGAAIGAEAAALGVAVVLGPGLNIKRNPLCGRSFEYLSEDPFLAGELGACWIEGLQSAGVGACPKHFAANNQEAERMSSDSLVDERTLREIYLPAFETAVKRARPATLMCAYNALNGSPCSDNVPLLRRILREEWGFAGVVLTDWGGMHDRVAALEAGVDLEMPASGGFFDAEVLAALRSGRLAAERLDESADRLVELARSLARDPGPRPDPGAHHELARRAAARSAVLLKNDDGALPLRQGARVALIGAMARSPRYQGTGSSRINPTRLSNLADGLDALGVAYRYCPGYLPGGRADATLADDAVSAARESDVAVVCVGLPDEDESEGFDRSDLALPAAHDGLVTRVAAANPETVVLLCAGAPVLMPWLASVRAVLCMYLAGQAGGLAAADLLTGAANPCGKLAETWSARYADVPSAGFYETGGRQAQYREGIYVGYRFYDKARRQVAFPFGHGLSYTSFEYRNLELSADELRTPYELRVAVTIANAGPRDGAEVVQLYVGNPAAPAYRAPKELRGFTKVLLAPGEERRVSFALDARTFSVYDPEEAAWVVPDGDYAILVGASSRDIRLRRELHVHGSNADPGGRGLPRWYGEPSGDVTESDFERLLGRSVPPPAAPTRGRYTLACSLWDMRSSLAVRLVLAAVVRTIRRRHRGRDPRDPTVRLLLASATRTPLKNLSQLSPDRMPRYVAEAIVHIANRRPVRALGEIAGRRRRKEKDR